MPDSLAINVRTTDLTEVVRVMGVIPRGALITEFVVMIVGSTSGSVRVGLGLADNAQASSEAFAASEPLIERGDVQTNGRPVLFSRIGTNVPSVIGLPINRLVGNRSRTLLVSCVGSSAVANTNFMIVCRYLFGAEVERIYGSDTGPGSKVLGEGKGGGQIRAPSVSSGGAIGASQLPQLG